jgi:hypothetical protein
MVLMLANHQIESIDNFTLKYIWEIATTPNGVSQ